MGYYNRVFEEKWILDSFNGIYIIDKLMDILIYEDFDKYSFDSEIYKILAFVKCKDINANILGKEKWEEAGILPICYHEGVTCSVKILYKI